MASLYKVTMNGEFWGQSVRNILYYSTTPGISVAQDDASRLSFLDAVATNLTTFFLPNVSTNYFLSSLTGVIVDEDNTVVSTYPVEVSVGEAGERAGATSAPYEVAILAFRLGNPGGILGNVVPRRSYIAIGGLLQSDIGNAGQFQPPSGWDEDMGSTFGSTITSNTLVHSPFRVGSEDAPGSARVGIVNSIVIRPYASVRRSRKIAPTGESGG